MAKKRLPKGPAPVLTGIKMRGRVTRILHGQGFGFIRADDDRDVFFHKADAVGTTFNDLAVGDRVTFELYEDKITGPRALRLRKATKATSDHRRARKM